MAIAANWLHEHSGYSCRGASVAIAANGLHEHSGYSCRGASVAIVAKGLQWHGGNAAYGVPVAVLVLRVAPRSYSGLVSTWHLWQIHLLH